MRVYHEPTAAELVEEAAKLRKKVLSGNATMRAAERLADIERQIKRYNVIKRGKSW